MNFARAICVGSYDVAMDVDSASAGVDRSGEVDRAEAASLQQKAMANEPRESE